MFIGAMILGPLAAYTMKWLDKLWDGKIKAGFEMLVNMFSAGIWAFVMAIVGFYPIAHLRQLAHGGARRGVEWLIDNNLLPLTSILIEPAKVLFLNNAINHGVLTPLGLAAGRGGRQVDPVPPRGEPRPRPRPAAGVHVLRNRRRARVGTGCGDHPVRRRHPRGVLPLRADEADPHPRPHRGRHDRRHDEHAASRPALQFPAAPGSILAIMAATAPGDHLGVLLSVDLRGRR